MLVIHLDKKKNYLNLSYLLFFSNLKKNKYKKFKIILDISTL